MNINSAIGEIINAFSKPFSLISICIECPLPTGVKVKCKLITNDGVETFTPPGGIGEFYRFVKAEKQRSKTPFNIVKLAIHPNGSWETEYHFDAQLQQHAEKMTE